MPATATLDPAAPSTRPTHRGTRILLSLAMVAALIFIAGAALPYFTLDQDRFAGYWPRRWWLLLHISAGMIALLSGPFQVWLGITDRKPQLHRRLGLVYITSVLVGSAAAVYLSLNTDFGWMFAAGLLGLAGAWLTTTGLAFLAIKRQLYDQHKEWMIRSYVTTTAFVSFRIIFLGLTTAGVGTLTEQLAISSWTCWAFPLVITEAVLQGRKILAVRAA
jgi:hypothetical protein